MDSNTEGVELDYLVAQKTGMLRMISGTKEEELGGYSPSTKWKDGGPIIEREAISIFPNVIRDGSGRYDGWVSHKNHGPISIGPTPLLSAMRCYVLRDDMDLSKLPERNTSEPL